jgi:hypothetical protein
MTAQPSFPRRREPIRNAANESGAILDTPPQMGSRLRGNDGNGESNGTL